MYCKEYKGYVLTIEEYIAGEFNHIHYSGKCEELGFEQKSHEYSTLMYGFHLAVVKRLRKVKQQLAKYLVNHVAQVAEYPDAVLDTVASMINVEVNCCDNGTYQIKTDGDVLFYGTFTDVLEDLTLHIFNDRK